MEPSKKTFLNDVANHQMTILRDDDVYRHIAFAKPGTRNLSFYLTTWPGHLAITGDMDSYIFSRDTDMFCFFRSGPDINPGYWEEKAVAVDTYGGIKTYSPDIYEQAVREAINSHAEYMTDEEAMIFRKDAEEYMLESTPSNEWEVYDRLSYRCPVTNEQPFCELYMDRDFKDYTYGYIWSIRAIRWGIEQYDAAKGQSK